MGLMRRQNNRAVETFVSHAVLSEKTVPCLAAIG